MRPRLVHAAIGLAFIAVADVAFTQDAVEARSSGPVFISIRPDVAIVRESFEVRLPAREARIRLPEIPPSAHDESLQIFDTRRELKLTAWSRVIESAKGPVITTPENKLEISFDHLAGETLKGTLEIQVAARTAGSKRFDLVYPVTGLTWQASYDVLVRGSLTNLAETVSVDVDGLIDVRNTTGRNYENVRLEVIGPDTLGVPPASKLPDRKSVV